MLIVSKLSICSPTSDTSHMYNFQFSSPRPCFCDLHLYMTAVIQQRKRYVNMVMASCQLQSSAMDNEPIIVWGMLSLQFVQANAALSF